MDGVGAPAHNPTIRPMRAGDVERVAALEAGAFTHPWKADTFLTLLERPGAELWVLDDPAAGVVGYLVLWCILDQGELANVAVADSHRDRGLGSRLVEHALAVARERGVANLYLEVRVSNERAVRLYRRVGFTETGRRPNYYESPREDALVMVLRL